MYGSAYRKYGGDFVKKVFIRKVTDIAELNKTDKNKLDRLRRRLRMCRRVCERCLTRANLRKTWRDLPSLRSLGSGEVSCGVWVY